MRRLPRSYLTYYAARGVPIDMPRADRQQSAYARALAAGSLSIETVDADERFADAVFIEDTVVVWDDRVLRTRMAPHREGEQRAVLDRLRATHEILTLPAGATLDGGDVMHAGETTYVGRSSRTNASGAGALREFLAPRRVVEVPVERTLHLKSAATWLGNGTLLAAGELVAVTAFDAAAVILTTPGEEKAANALRVGSHLLCLDGYSGTGQRLAEFARSHQLTLQPLDMSEFEKGDGSLTCLSVIL